MLLYIQWMHVKICQMLFSTFVVMIIWWSYNVLFTQWTVFQILNKPPLHSWTKFIWLILSISFMIYFLFCMVIFVYDICIYGHHKVFSLTSSQHARSCFSAVALKRSAYFVKNEAEASMNSSSQEGWCLHL